MSDRRTLDELTAEPVDEAELAQRLTDLNKLIELMRPAVQQDGGDLVLTSADVRTGEIEVQLQGACSSCAVSSSTLEQGVERLLTQRLPWVTSVSGGVEEANDWDASAALGKGGWISNRDDDGPTT
ncbi:MAG: NifU family protein [Actinomycetota bacterium]